MVKRNKKRDHKTAVARYNNRMALKKVSYTTLDTKAWFETILRPELDKVDKLIMSKATNSDEETVVKYWWNAFYQNTFCLCYLVARKDFHYQVAMTMRLLVEISADVNFIKRYPQNIPKLVGYHTKMQKKQQANPKYSYRDAIADAGGIKLYKYDKKGKPVFIKTEDRVGVAYDKKYGGDLKETISQIYSLLCIYSHFNHLATIWEGNKRGRDNKQNQALQDNLYLFQFYPLLFHCLVSDVGELLSVEELVNYDPKPMRAIFDDVKKWEAEW